MEPFPPPPIPTPIPLPPVSDTLGIVDAIWSWDNVAGMISASRTIYSFFNQNALSGVMIATALVVIATLFIAQFANRGDGDV